MSMPVTLSDSLTGDPGTIPHGYLVTGLDGSPVPVACRADAVALAILAGETTVYNVATCKRESL